VLLIIASLESPDCLMSFTKEPAMVMDPGILNGEFPIGFPWFMPLLFRYTLLHDTQPQVILSSGEGLPCYIWYDDGV
jgi:hypothetical protein